MLEKQFDFPVTDTAEFLIANQKISRCKCFCWLKLIVVALPYSQAMNYTCISVTLLFYF